MESKSFFIKLQLSSPLSIKEYVSFVSSLKNYMYTKIKTLTTFSLEEDIDVFGNDLVNKVSAKNIDDELNEPTAIIAFDENGKYDLLLKKLKKVITDFSIEKYPDNKIISVFVTDDVINSKSNWFEIPN